MVNKTSTFLMMAGSVLLTLSSALNSKVSRQGVVLGPDFISITEVRVTPLNSVAKGNATGPSPRGDARGGPGSVEGGEQNKLNFTYEITK